MSTTLAESLIDVAAEPEKRKRPFTGFKGTVINIAKCFCGASSFELPWAFRQGGLVGAIVGVIAMAVLSNACFAFLISVSRSSGLSAPTYPQLGSACLGRPGELLVWLGMVLMTIGVVGSYFLFVGEILSDLIGQSQTLCVLIAAVPGALLSLLRSTHLLSYSSGVGLLALCVACVAVMVDATTRPDVELQPLRTYLSPPVRVSTYPLFLGNAGYLFLISTAILPMQQAMGPEQRHFGRALTVAQCIVTLPNMAFALVACVAYSSTPAGVNSNIVENLRPGAVSLAVKIFMAINQTLTVPLFLIPMSEAFERRLLAADAFGTPAGERKRSAGRLVLALASAGMALLVPSFGILTGLTGAFGNNLLAFVSAPVLYFAYHRAAGRWASVGARRGAELALLALLLAFGIYLAVMGTESTVVALL